MVNGNGNNSISEQPVIGITMGDPAGIGPEVIVKALADPEIRKAAKFIVFGMNEQLCYAADRAEIEPYWGRHQHEKISRDYPYKVVVADYDEYSVPPWLKRPMPAGKAFMDTRNVLADLDIQTICTNANCPNQGQCPRVEDCTTAKSGQRSIKRPDDQASREALSQYMAIQEGQAAYKKRAPAIEGAFGIIKAVLGIRRFLLRGLANVRMEWTWICTAYTLKKLLAREANSASGTPKTTNPPGKTPPKRHYGPTIQVSAAQFLHPAPHPIPQTKRCPEIINAAVA